MSAPASTQRAWRVDDAAAAYGVSRDVLYAAARNGDLVFRYPTSRPVIDDDEMQRWLRSLPTEAPKKRRVA